jgi:hypothetical protein
MNPVSGVKTAIQQPQKPFQAEQASSVTARHSGQTLKFGNAEETFEAKPLPRRRLGLLKAGKILKEHLQHAENRDEIKAMGQYFAPRFAKYGTALVPFGFLLAGPVDWWAGKHVDQGRQKIEALIAQGKLNPEVGPLGCAMQIEKNWQSALDRKNRLPDDEAAKALNNIRTNWNRMMDHLFPDDADGISIVREKFKLHDNGKVFNFIGRAFHANRNQTVRFFKNFARKASNPFLGIILKPIRWLMLGLGLAYQGILMLENGPAVKKLLGQAVRRVA